MATQTLMMLLIALIVLTVLLVVLVLFVFARTGQQRAHALEQKTLQQQSLTQLHQITQDVDAGFEKSFEQSTQHVSALREHSGALAREQRMELGQQLNHSQAGVTDQLKALRENQTSEAQSAREHLLTQLTQTTTQLVQQLQQLNETTERRLNHMRENIEQRLSSIETNNAKKLEEMRVTVDEKLHATLEQRLGESFKQVSDRLEQVHLGLGEMKNLAQDVGGLQRVLTNVKDRGNWGEMQLASLLENVFTPDRYAANVKIKPDSNEMVDFAIKLPGRGEDIDDVVWLPIDAKFPKESYERMQKAQDEADADGFALARKGLFADIKREAKSISDKYIAPPHTTDFAVLFLPTEGLFAEVAREAGLLDTLQREYRIVVAGPTTLNALLNSLHMGFRTLAMEKRATEVWKVLGAVKTEFGKFGDVLASTKKKLEEAANHIDKAQTRTRVMSKALSGVEQMDSAVAVQLLGLGDEAHPDGNPSVQE